MAIHKGEAEWQLVVLREAEGPWNWGAYPGVDPATPLRYAQDDSPRRGGSLSSCAKSQDPSEPRFSASLGPASERT